MMLHASAHSTGLSSGSVNVLTMANMTHWFLYDEQVEKKVLAEFRRITTDTANVICVTSRPKKDEFWSAFLSGAKAHPLYNAKSEFLSARRRCGDKHAIADRLIINPKLFETSLQVILTSPKDAADYCKSISPYANIPESDINHLAEECFQRSCGNNYNVWVSDWLISAFAGPLRRET